MSVSVSFPSIAPTSNVNQGPPQFYLKLIMEAFINHLDRNNRIFEEFSLKLDLLNANLDFLIAENTVHYDEDKFSGFIRRMEVPVGTRFIVQADLHGDLASLVCLLEGFQKEGFLDENYVPKEGIYLIFLGDYVDRGPHSLEVLFILALLKRHSDQVILLRGNHENTEGHANYLKQSENSRFYDGVFAEYLETVENKERLAALYKTFPDALYVTPIGAGAPQYFLYCHGLPPYYFEPNLAFGAPTVQFVPHSLRLSERQANISSLLHLSSLDRRIGKQASTFLWGRVGQTLDFARDYYPPLFINTVLLTQTAVIETIFRGHDHQFQREILSRQNHRACIVFTLPVSMGGVYRSFAKEDGKSALTVTFQLPSRLAETKWQAFLTATHGPIETKLWPNMFNLTSP